MIASPGDVSEERKIAREIIIDWNNLHSFSRKIVLLPLLWEHNSTPSMEDRAQGVINKQVLKNADLLIGIFWTRIGTPTGRAISGTVEEIEEHINAQKPAMLYFSTKPASLDKVDTEQYEAVKILKNEYLGRGLMYTFDSTENFKEVFQRHLQMKINDRTAFPDYDGQLKNTISTQQSVEENISQEARSLLKEASKDANGQIMKLSFMGGFFQFKQMGSN
jgi:hypothetical protein